MGAAQRGAGRERQLWFEHSFAVRATGEPIIEGDPSSSIQLLFDRKLNFVKEPMRLRFSRAFWNVGRDLEILTLMQTGKARYPDCATRSGPMALIGRRG